MPHPVRPSRRTPAQTRDALVASGLHLFGRDGFEATSTRALARHAQANIASIAYHFGGKDGLRLACVESVADRLGAVMGRALLESDPGTDAAVARSILEAAFTALVGFIVARPEARDIAPFMMREMATPGPALDHIYNRLIEPVHVKLCSLWSTATGAEAASPSVRLLVFSLIGQVIYFRIGRAVVLRRMGWDDFGPDEVDRVTGVVIGNLGALIDAARGTLR